jgi:hypothetical protein
MEGKCCDTRGAEVLEHSVHAKLGARASVMRAVRSCICRKRYVSIYMHFLLVSASSVFRVGISIQNTQNA